MNPSPNLFFLLISPSTEIMHYVAYLKKKVAMTLGHSFRSRNSIAHITLYQYRDFHNESLLYHFEDKISTIAPFNIHLKGFNVFPNNHTLYLEIVNKEEVCTLAEAIHHKKITPHITIARNLRSQDFEKAYNTLKDEICSYSFPCRQITVLKWTGRWSAHTHLSMAC